MALLMTLPLLFAPVAKQDAKGISRSAITCEVTKWNNGISFDKDAVSKGSVSKGSETTTPLQRES